MENKLIKLELTYVTGDWRAYVLRYRLRAILNTAGLIFVAYFALYVIGSRFLTESLPESFRLVLAAFLFGVPIITVIINLIGVEQTARAKARRQPVILTANEIGVSYTEEHRTAALEWEAYKQGIEQKDRFVFTSGSGGLLVPKRCFASIEQIEEFRELAKQGLNGKFQIT